MDRSDRPGTRLSRGPRRTWIWRPARRELSSEIPRKNTRLDFERSLRRPETVLKLSEGGERTGGQIDAVTECEQPGDHDKDGDHAEEVPYAESAGAHGGNFAVRGQTAESDKDADQHAHGNGVSESTWDGVKKYRCHA